MSTVLGKAAGTVKPRAAKRCAEGHRLDGNDRSSDMASMAGKSLPRDAAG